MKKMKRLTEAKIQKMIASDPDNPELTDAQIARARPFKDVFPDLHASIKRSRGRPKSENPREAVTLRLSPDTIEKFKATGDDWRARMAKALERAKV
ncbi:MAG: BrnA antitoxin family protein [Rhizobiales bacterium]|nr:BrnA antitoxin family protein [Hyphomicrobiales bacterium]